MKRLFTRAERSALLRIAGYKCENCGVSVTIDTMEADHHIPHSDKGDTVLGNAKCLCKQCNRSKSNMNKYHNLASRPWQVSAFDTTYKMIQDNTHQSALVNACPGAGKTRYGVALGTWAFDTKHIDRMVIISPRGKISKQWKEDFRDQKIKLVDSLSQKHMEEMIHDETVDTHGKQGIVLTYQMLSYPITQAWLQILATRYRTMFIFDEVHWNSEMNTWGRGVIDSAKHARFVLALSGTPWRDDNLEIPFVQYENGFASENLGLSYGEAMTNKKHWHEDMPIVRPVEFYDFGGKLSVRERNSGELSEFSFNDDYGFDPHAPEDQPLGGNDFDDAAANKRLRLAMEPSSTFWHEIIDQAHDRLMAIRKVHKRAGGIVFARDEKHAQAVRDYLDRKHRVRSILVTSKEGGAIDQIDRFAATDKEWLVSIKMVSEGVDIPRLRVVAFMHNISTEKNFQQSIARALRVDYNCNLPSLEQIASVFMPADPRFKHYAMKFLEASNYALGQRKVKYCPECGAENPIGTKVCLECGYEWIPGDLPPKEEKIYEVYEAEPVEEGATIAGEYFTASQMDEDQETLMAAGEGSYWIEKISRAEGSQIIKHLLKKARNGEYDGKEL